MSDFGMASYYNQYMDTLRTLERAKTRLEGRKARSVFIKDEDDYEQWKADVAAAETELKAAQDEVERLEYLSRTGKEPPKPKNECRKSGYGGGKGYMHFPANPSTPKHIIPR